ncbi:1-acyl-sn-glycerol-3-phosphate acyltransferase [bacterium]|nr:1-acyl-sn-glycerol-3-phosphate acyltransferase [bacterium]
MREYGKDSLLRRIVTIIVTMFFLVLPFWIFMKIFTRTRIIGKEYIQKARLPFLFASNHVSMLDDAFIGPLLFLPRGFWDYKFMPYHTPERKNFYVGPVFSFIMEHAKCIPLTRGKGLNQPGIGRIIQALKNGGSVVMYPEGTRTRSGRLGTGKPGIGKVIYESGCNVIPCYHSGFEKVLPIGKKIPRFSKEVIIKVGEPLDLSRFFTMENKLETWKAIADELIVAIRKLMEEDRTERSFSG